jgi:hypothetical protein
MQGALRPRCTVRHPMYFNIEWQFILKCDHYGTHEAHMLTNLMPGWSTKCIEVMGYVGF